MTGFKNPVPLHGKFTRQAAQIATKLENDMNSNAIELNLGGTSVTPDLMHDHTNPLVYTVSPGFSGAVTIQDFIQAENFSLHYIKLNNLNNNNTVTFVFGPKYEFLEIISNNIVSVLPGKVYAFWGVIENGKMYLRVSLDTSL